MAMLGGWGFVKKTVTYAGCANADEHIKWQGIDNKVLGFMATTLSMELQQQIVWEYDANHISLTAGLWEKMEALFGKKGIPGQFMIFSDLLRVQVSVDKISEGLSTITSLFRNPLWIF
jgi:hypothetical protein